MSGSGPALLLIHGGGQTRQSWAERGYVERLNKKFTVVRMDLRGSGDSGRPNTAEAYALDTVLADILAADNPAVWRSNAPAKGGDTGKLFARIIAQAVAMKAGSNKDKDGPADVKSPTEKRATPKRKAAAKKARRKG